MDQGVCKFNVNTEVRRSFSWAQVSWAQGHMDEDTYE